MNIFKEAGLLRTNIISMAYETSFEMKCMSLSFQNNVKHFYGYIGVKIREFLFPWKREIFWNFSGSRRFSLHPEVLYNLRKKFVIQNYLKHFDAYVGVKRWEFLFLWMRELFRHFSESRRFSRHSEVLNNVRERICIVFYVYVNHYYEYVRIEIRVFFHVKEGIILKIFGID